MSPTKHASTSRVMVVEDYADFRTAITTALRMNGMRYAAVSTAEEAMAVLDNVTPDLLITDLRLPGMWGDELIASIRRRSDGLRDLPTVIMSCHDTGDRAGIVTRCGASAFWDKVDITPETLPKLVEGLRRVGAGACED